jgi:DHA1 family bicyclomycin/chloramphenicol resistance-like MFS transporter
MLLLISMTAVGPLSLNIVIPSLPSFASGLQASTATAQLAVSLYLLALASGQLVMGPLADKFGRRPVLLAGLTLAVAACIAGALATNISQLVLARVAQAIGTATGVVVSRTIVRDLFERDRAAATLGLISTAMVVAPMAAPLIGGLLDTHLHWRAVFVAMGGSVLAVLAWATLALPETRGTQTAHGAGFFADFKALIGNAPFLGYVLAGGFGTAGHYSFLGGAPHVVVNIMGRTSAEYGLWFVMAAFGYMAGNFTVSRLTARYGINTMILCGIVIQAIAMAMAVAMAIYVPHWGLIILFWPQTVASFGAGLMLPTTIAGAISVRPQSAGTASGLAGFAQMGLGAAGAQFSGFIVAASTTAVPLFLDMSLIVVLAALAFVLVRPRDLFKRTA